MPDTARVLGFREKRSMRQPAGADLLGGKYWAIMPERVAGLRAIADQVLADPKALTAWADAPVPDTFVATMRDGIATVRVNDVLTRTWSVWSYFFGGTTYELLAKDLTQLRNDGSIRGIILSVDSPGGEVAGCGELSALIREIRGVKPIVAHAAGLMCSAAYWLGSAADECFVDPAGIVGSLGTCATFADASEYWSNIGVEWIRLVSSQSPRKNQDPATPEGREDWQATLDALAAVFIRDVARNRSTDEATVLQSYGRGGVLVGQAAVAAGLADAQATHDEVHTALLDRIERATARTALSAEVPNMAKKQSLSASVDPAARAKAEDEPTDKEKQKDTDGAEDVPEDEQEDEEETPPSTQSAQTLLVVAGQTPNEQAASFEALAPDAAAILWARGAAAERERIAGIDAIAAKVKGERAAKLVAEARKDPKATRQTLADQLIDSGAALGAAVLGARQADEAAVDHPSNAGTGEPSSEIDQSVQFILTAGRPLVKK